ncbi:hypothetical protein HID58_078965 [Brassica napus]|uniref:Uncharacterized protein n=1 Tax=Brassica napus TaxID=3708 RepID=A0ABQ7XEF9_BRANA|nr:hypothetical protein HID58_078965 [Brassica napus]
MVGRKKFWSSSRQRQMKRFLNPSLSATLSLWLIFSLTSSLEVSSAHRISGESPGELLIDVVGHPHASTSLPSMTLYPHRSFSFLSLNIAELCYPPFEALDLKATIS